MQCMQKGVGAIGLQFQGSFMVLPNFLFKELSYAVVYKIDCEQQAKNCQCFKDVLFVRQIL